MSRKIARVIALHTLYELTYDVQSPEDTLASIVSEETRARLAEEVAVYAKPLSEKDEEFVRRLVLGVTDRREMLDEEIGKRSINWKTERISRVALSVLRMAALEILYLQEDDAAVSINEAVELTKKYDGPESAAFVNGILGTLIRDNGQ